MSSSNNRRLHLNRRKGILGGVCAGLADYFCISVAIVRILFVIAVFTWPLTVLVYVVLFFCLSERPPRLGELRDNVVNSRMGRHFRNVDYRKGLYKSRHNRRISGVCAGIGNYLEINPFWIRLAAVLSLFFGPFAIFAYVAAAVIMDPNPDELPTAPPRRSKHRRDYEERAEDNATSDIPEEILCRRKRRARAAHSYDRATDAPVFSATRLRECTEKFSRLESRLQNLEATITSKKFKLHSEFKRMST